MKKLSPRILSGLALGVVLVVTLIGWFLVVSPQRSRAAKLDDQIAQAQTDLAAARHTQTSGVSKEDVAKYRLLQLAMPDNADTPAMLRQLIRAARLGDVRIDSLKAQAKTTATSYDALPMDVVVTGRFPGIRRFLYALRTQVATAKNGVHVTGRLFAVDSLDFAPGEDELPQLTATVHLRAFVYHPSTPSAETAVTPPTTSASAAGRTP